MIALPADPTRNGSPPPPVETPGGDPLEYISVSRLKSFLSCRLRFHFEKVLAITKPVSPALHFGRAIHAALQHFNKARWRGGDASDTAVIAAFTESFAHPEPGHTVEWTDANEPAELRAKGETLLRAFLAAGVHSLDEKPMGVEVAVEAHHPDLALPLFGVLDLVKSDRRVVDYKTCAATPDPALELWLHETQVTAYALLVEHATEAPSTGTDLAFLVKTKTPKIIVHPVAPPTQVQRDRFARLVEVYANGVANEAYYPSPGQHCAWCAYRTECAAWKGAA
ncbi:MAG: PD-(D/E)XK nuclease family protein [Verrucomicrobia bacterium]|nr:PD-(D/E)XK nuclease family protein [Verrucomicrobiota bacterium]